ncbi:TetR/AcrR family transcriptional regulator [Alteromonas oceanisediminis]|uniref:TetR/AcrR family transcriptional regulator n=1 Tax=Alteromonas oceanisediminis TaxID=2836180 RepID=UPI001BDB6C4F|nr:TetR/AcrR family transcriptional regulator [Alteromonas oceanisediminis]MBT0585259.1 TetR/AcrR family transcriptional regulator [Alteromonas oceanisediminis]
MTNQPKQAVTKTRRKRGETRVEILRTVMRLLMQEGPDVISTTRLAKEVGIVQSGFYAHFKTIEECLHAVVHEIDVNVRTPLSNSMAQLRLTDASDVDLLEQFFDELFDTVQNNWSLMELFLHYRGDHSVVGRLIGEFESSLVADLQAHLRALQHSDTVEPVFDDMSDLTLSALAHLMMSQSLVGISQWKSDAISRKMLARYLAEQTAHIGKSIEAAQARDRAH